MASRSFAGLVISNFPGLTRARRPRSPIQHGGLTLAGYWVFPLSVWDNSFGLAYWPPKFAGDRIVLFLNRMLAAKAVELYTLNICEVTVLVNTGERACHRPKPR